MTSLGSGDLRFVPVQSWPQLPEHVTVSEAVGVAVDSRGRAFVLNRGSLPVLVFDVEGRYLCGWGEGQFTRPHGIWLAADETLYLVDDQGHSVRQFTLDGKLLRTIGPAGTASDTGAEGFDFRTIRRAGPPFNLPTNAVVSSRGEVIVADGYGNARVHVFSPEGRLLYSWGQPGDRPGEFRVPHGLGIDRDDRLYVADRENSRIQVFTTNGTLLAEWRDVVRPCEVYVAADDLVYVAELSRRNGLFPWMQPDPSAPGARLSIFDLEGRLVTRWGGGQDPRQPGEFYAPHDVWVDAAGCVYVAEVTVSAAANAVDTAAKCPTLRKFARTQ